jgi:hypothetical protein
MKRLAAVSALAVAALASASAAASGPRAGKRGPAVRAAAAKGRPASADGADAACGPGKGGAAVWWSPQAPVAGAPLKLLGVGSAAGTLAVRAPGAAETPVGGLRRFPSSASVAGELAAPRAGRYRVRLLRGDAVDACAEIDVAAHPPRAEAPVGKVVWEARRAWDRRVEDLYSSFIEQLFDAPPDKSVDFRPLSQALRDPARNFLFGYLGLREDDARNKAAIPAAPDCADLPYFLRAYFAWKLGLPFAYRDCDRGTDSRPPRCTSVFTNEQAPHGHDLLAAVRAFLRDVTNHVQSGSARTALDDDQTDYYPVRLEKKALRPGVIYADPYGHVMMIVKWIDQTPRQGGLLLAVDGQPDTSVGRKRFWEGTFLFTNDTKSAGPGFKAFRPVVRAASGQLEALPNRSVGEGDDPAHAPYSGEQGKLGADEFYARMGKLINPDGLDAAQAYAETLDALVEQLTVRLGSVDNGEKYMRDGSAPPIPMPEGAKIFETTGPWEDYATPSRDMRLLIAMNVLLALPDRIVHHPELYNLAGRKPAAVSAEIRKLHEQRIGERGIEYRRSDGTPWKLTVADLLARRSALEIAYNPNDCVEVRWGAKEGTPEYATCKRHLPDDQRARMAEYRLWFREAKRPPR